MNFFRSEEHLHEWEGFQEKTEGWDHLPEFLDGALLRPPISRTEGEPDYVSQMSEYMAGFLGKLDTLPEAGDHWRMRPLEKFGFSLAMKLGLM